MLSVGDAITGLSSYRPVVIIAIPWDNQSFIYWVVIRETKKLLDYADLIILALLFLAVFLLISNYWSCCMSSVCLLSTQLFIHLYTPVYTGSEQITAWQLWLLGSTIRKTLKFLSKILKKIKVIVLYKHCSTYAYRWSVSSAVWHTPTALVHVTAHACPVLKDMEFSSNPLLAPNLVRISEVRVSATAYCCEQKTHGVVGSYSLNYVYQCHLV